MGVEVVSCSTLLRVQERFKTFPSLISVSFTTCPKVAVLTNHRREYMLLTDCPL